ncbi:MAG: DUF1552 domain-containing protein [Nannocystaceae bacterium]
MSRRTQERAMFNRRQILTAAGALATAPLLVGAGFRGRGRPAAGEAPRRFVIFLEGNGVRPACMRDPLTQQTLEGIAGKPIDSNRDYAHEDPVLIPAAPLSEARSLGALAAGMGELSLVDRSALVLGLSSTNLGGGHSTDYGALSAARALGGPASATIETVLGQIPTVRGDTPFDAVRIGTGASSTPLNYSSCAFDKGKPAPILLDTAASFTSLFGSVAAGQAGADFAARKRLLEYGLEDVQIGLKAFSGPKAARDKLETYEASLFAMIARNDQIEGMKDALLAVKPPEPGELNPDPYASTAPIERFNLQVDIAIASLLAGLTNVIVVSMGSGSYYWSEQYPTLLDFYPGKQMMGGHDLRHAESPEAHEVLHELTARYVAGMARMARVLADHPEDGGTMLDNTLLLYMPDNGEKHHSNAEEWAMLLMGGQNLGFKTDGRSVTFPGNGHKNNRQISNVFNSVLYGAGMPTDTFGHANPASRIAEGPLSEIWGEP